VDQNRSFAFRCPGAADRGALRDAAFILEKLQALRRRAFSYYRPSFPQPHLHLLRVALAGSFRPAAARSSSQHPGCSRHDRGGASLQAHSQIQ
jgi:hypothetical protein